MQCLFVHQNFPGQYRHLAPAFGARPGWRVMALGENPADALPGVLHARYAKPEGAGAATHPYLRQAEAHVRRGQAVARAAQVLRRQGLRPDIICAHPGWGEALFLRDVFPEARLLLYCEYFYGTPGGDVGFDPVHAPLTIDAAARSRVQNTTQLLQLPSADWGVAPTRWQWSRYPHWARERISVVHEGIDTGVARPEGEAGFTLPDGHRLRPGDEVVTFAARNLEPYRGWPQFMRSLPILQRLRPQAQVVVVGADAVSYGRPPPEGGTWRDSLLRELDGQLDLSRLHFAGRLPYPALLALFRASAAHAYLTYPFVLSWSMLDAMACGVPLLASATAPVTEVVQDGINARLVDFFDPEAIARGLAAMLADPAAQRGIRAAARRTIVDRYDLRGICLPRQVALVEAVLRHGGLPAGRDEPPPAPG